MPASLTEKSIPLSSTRQALAVFSSGESAAAEIRSKLNLSPYKAIILVFGSTDSTEKNIVSRLTQLCRRGIGTAAVDTEAVVLDSGSSAGIAALIGAGIASRSTKISLIGVAPKGKISYPGIEAAPPDAEALEPNHSHFVLVEGDRWGVETPTLFNLADALIHSSPKSEVNVEEDGAGMFSFRRKEPVATPTEEKRIPALAILIGGDEVARGESVQAVRRRLPLIVVKGSGGFAKRVIDAYNAYKNDPQTLNDLDDPDLAEIVADGEIHVHSLDEGIVEGMNRLIRRELATDEVLKQAWHTFAIYDATANEQQRRFKRLQGLILWFGVVGTALAITHQVLSNNALNVPFLKFMNLSYGTVLQVILIIIPITVTALVAASNRFKQGNKWMLLRAAAESIKREIYKYRVNGYYKKFDNVKQQAPASQQNQTFDTQEQQMDVLTPEQELSHRVEDISRRLMRTEVNSTALIPYDKGIYPPAYVKMKKKKVVERNSGEEAKRVKDNGFSALSPDDYVKVRLDDQVKYFRGRTPGLHKMFYRLTTSILVVGALGTLLSALNAPVWIALTTTIAGAFTSYLGYMQVENTLTKYNQAATDLENVKGWWNALPASDQAVPKNIQLLVDHTEDVLQTELDGWVQQMKDALESLRRDQVKSDEQKEEKQDPDKAAATKTVNGQQVPAAPAQPSGDANATGTASAGADASVNQTSASTATSASQVATDAVADAASDVATNSADNTAETTVASDNNEGEGAKENDDESETEKDKPE